MKSVVAALIVRENKVLICQRTKDQPMPLKWEFPGGKVEPGEKPKEALRRELEEELGILATVGPEVATVRHNYAQGTEGNSVTVELHFFLVEKFESEIQNRIFHDVRWVSKEEMPEYDFLEADVALINDIAAGKVPLTDPRSRR
jgi:8-oxo-dGTP diphosphatase